MNIIITVDINQSSALYILSCFRPLRTFSPTTLLVCEQTHPPHPWHDAMPVLHAHEYTAVHTRGRHLFSRLHISSLYSHVY